MLIIASVHPPCHFFVLSVIVATSIFMTNNQGQQSNFCKLQVSMSHEFFYAWLHISAYKEGGGGIKRGTSQIETRGGKTIWIKAEEIMKITISTPYSAVFLDEDRNPSKPFNTLPHCPGSCK